MGFFDELGAQAQNAFDRGSELVDRGIGAAKNAVSAVAVEQQPFTRALVKVCAAAAAAGWHEANGGNISYILTAEEVNACRQYFYPNPSAWVPLEGQAPELGDCVILVTRAGSCMRTVGEEVPTNFGLVQLNQMGNACRVVWGLKNEGVPTSELSTHIATLAWARAAGNHSARVFYHAHPANLIALSSVEALDAVDADAASRLITRALWKTMAECIIVAPHGVQLVDWFAPGTPELADACRLAATKASAALAVNHGVFALAENVDAAFNLVETLEKAAGIRLAARAACGGAEPGRVIPDAGLMKIAQRYSLDIDISYLD